MSTTPPSHEVLGKQNRTRQPHGSPQSPMHAELRLLAAVRRSIREHGGEPSSRQVDELLDERLAHCGRAREFAKLVETYGAGK
jgi:hypothetical protein